MNDSVKSNVAGSAHWLRLAFMLLFAVIIQVAGAVMWVVVIVQFLFALLSGQSNENLRRFGHSLSIFIFQIWQFLSYNNEEKPFPFKDWPNDQ